MVVGKILLRFLSALGTIVDVRFIAEDEKDTAGLTTSSRPARTSTTLFDWSIVSKRSSSCSQSSLCRESLRNFQVIRQSISFRYFLSGLFALR